MAVEGVLSGAGGLFLTWMTTGLFWMVLVVLMLIATWGSLLIRKKRKLRYPTLVLSDLGNGKMGVEITRSGWFKSHITLFGLWDYGKEEYLRLKDGRKIQSGSSVDFHDINGKRGLVCKRKSDDNLIVVPIDKMKVINRDLLARIAPADFREASVDIIKQAERETRGRMEQIMQWILFAGLIIFAMISIILITQMVQRGQAEAKDLILKAGKCGINYIQGSSP